MGLEVDSALVVLDGFGRLAQGPVGAAEVIAGLRHLVIAVARR